jgi:PilZ domain
VAPVRKAGTIEFSGAAFSCMVRNLSTSGAALDVPSVIGIPDRFTLTIPTEDLHFPCHTIWREEMRVGVAFEGRRLAAHLGLHPALSLAARWLLWTR